MIDRGSYLLIHPDTKRPVDADDPSTFPCNDADAQAKAKVGPIIEPHSRMYPPPRIFKKLCIPSQFIWCPT